MCQVCCWFKSNLRWLGSSHSITGTMCGVWWAGLPYLLLLANTLLLSCLAPHQIVLYGSHQELLPHCQQVS